MARVMHKVVWAMMAGSLSLLHAAPSATFSGVGGSSGAGHCLAWWQFEQTESLPSYFVRKIQNGAGIEVGFAEAQWKEEVVKLGKAGVLSVRSVKKDHSGKPLLLFQFKLINGQVKDLNQRLQENRFVVEWNCSAEVAAQWIWPLPTAPEPAPPASEKKKSADEVKKKGVPSPLDDFYRQVSSEVVAGAKQQKGFVVQGARRLVVKGEKVLLYAKPEIQGAIVRPLNPGDTLLSPRRQGDWYIVHNGDREAFVAATDVRRLEELTSQDEEMLRRLIQRQMANLNTVGEKVPLRESEMLEGTVVDSTKSDSSQVAQRPGKQIYRYSSFGRRDPFVPFEEPEIEGISIDEVQLVGIIWDAETPLAIFEDIRVKGISYTLREGDEVLNGNVFKISQDEVIFLLTEFGVSRKFSMPLPRIIE